MESLNTATHLERNRTPDCLEMLVEAQRELVEACAAAAPRGDPDVQEGLNIFTEMGRRSLEALRPFLHRHGRRMVELRGLTAVPGRTGAGGLRRELHDLYALHAELEIALSILMRAAEGDDELSAACGQLVAQSRWQRDWLQNRLDRSA